jgi:predicted ArsR family transcriptional regulator
MSDSGKPEPYTEVNEAVGEEWEAETTPYDRVREVISHVYTPQSADVVADNARTSPKTARKHLTALADEGFVATETGDTGAKLFRRSPESLVVEPAADILARTSIDELNARVAAMREEIADFQAEYGVETPEELTIDRTNQALSGDASAEIDQETISEWQTTRRNLAFANAALSVATAEKFVDGEASTTNGGAVPQ